MPDDLERDPLAQQLRESLARHAAQAPAGDPLAERIISAADQASAASRDTHRRGWRTWALPAVAAAAVAGVVVAVVGIENFHPNSSQPAASNGVSPLLSTAPAPMSSAPTSPAPTSSAPTSAVTSPSPSNASDLANVQVLDLTFVSEDEGWALASADCLRGPGRCTALLHTTDGTNWTSMPGAQFNVAGVSAGCAIDSPNCVTNLRFANDRVGYAFGPKAFFMTTDGGSSWDRQDGGAVQLETLDQNVIRVISSGSGCPSWCDVQVETSPIGSSTWTPATLGVTPGDGVQLVRGGGANAYLLFPGHTAGGAARATSVLYRSADDGRTWENVGEPCPQTGQEIDSAAIAAGGDDRVSVLCMTRQAPQRWHAATSGDAGAHFAPQPGRIPPATAVLLTGDPDTVLVAAGEGMARSTDGGRTWDSVPDVTGQVTFVGFESKQVGRAVSDNRVIWTTRDGGQTWTAARFG